MSEKPKIRVFVAGRFGSDLSCLAVAEDGDELTGHISSSVDWAKSDMGVTSKRKHELYAAKYPDGYDVVWVDDWKADPVLAAQAETNQSEAGGTVAP